MTKSTRFLIGALIVAFPLSAIAQPFGRGNRGMRGQRGLLPPGPILTQLATEVGLSKNQVARIKKISFDIQRQCIGLRSKLGEAQLNLRQAMSSDKTPTEKNVRNLVHKIGALETKLQQQHVIKVLRIRKTMSLKQWRKLETVSAERRWGNRGRWGRGNGMGMGQGRGMGNGMGPGRGMGDGLGPLRGGRGMGTGLYR